MRPRKDLLVSRKRIMCTLINSSINDIYEARSLPPSPDVVSSPSHWTASNEAVYQSGCPTEGSDELRGSQVSTCFSTCCYACDDARATRAPFKCQRVQQLIRRARRRERACGDAAGSKVNGVGPLWTSVSVSIHSSDSFR